MGLWNVRHDYVVRASQRFTRCRQDAGSLSGTQVGWSLSQQPLIASSNTAQDLTLLAAHAVMDVSGVKLVCDPREHALPLRHAPRLQRRARRRRLPVPEPQCGGHVRLRQVVRRLTACSVSALASYNVSQALRARVLRTVCWFLLTCGALWHTAGVPEVCVQSEGPRMLLISTRVAAYAARIKHAYRCVRQLWTSVHTGTWQSLQRHYCCQFCVRIVIRSMSTYQRLLCHALAWSTCFGGRVATDASTH